MSKYGDKNYWMEELYYDLYNRGRDIGFWRMVALVMQVISDLADKIGREF